ncbi:MAG: hypothetical protein K2G53_06045 [Muribaculaceae bacterium]|nr:hypothetical protein [Muribaculaceae bacterium]
MSKFIWLTKMECYGAYPDYKEIPLFVNIDAIVYVEYRAVHLKNGETILCKESNDHIVALVSE